MQQVVQRVPAGRPLDQEISLAQLTQRRASLGYRPDPRGSPWRMPRDLAPDGYRAAGTSARSARRAAGKTRKTRCAHRRRLRRGRGRRAGAVARRVSAACAASGQLVDAALAPAMASASGSLAHNLTSSATASGSAAVRLAPSWAASRSDASALVSTSRLSVLRRQWPRARRAGCGWSPAPGSQATLAAAAAPERRRGRCHARISIRLPASRLR